jgi:hypothetical protein
MKHLMELRSERRGHPMQRSVPSSQYRRLSALAACVLAFMLPACGGGPPSAQEAEHTKDEEHTAMADEEHSHEDENHDHDAADASIDELVAALEPTARGETLNVVATTTIIGDIVGQVE